MKVLIFIFTLFLIGCFAKENLLKHNKTPKVTKLEPVDFTSVCDECQEVVKRFAEAAKDPAKMAIMKEMLSALCHETDYEMECKIFVSKLDIFIDKLLPYLKNPHAVCAKFHMCSNSRIDRFHRVGLLFAKRYLNKLDGAKDLICEECQFAAHELLEVIDDHTTQTQIHDFISSNICSHLGQYRGTCDVILDDFLPDLFQELHNMLANGKQFCVDLKLCTPQQVQLQRMSSNDMKNKLMGPKYVQNLLKKFQNLQTAAPQNLAMSCMECKIVVDMALDELKTPDMLGLLKNVTESVLCGFLPTEFGCNDFINIYGQTVVYMTLQQVDSEGLCEGLKACSNDSYAKLSAYAKAELHSMKCDTCEVLATFVRVELAKPKAKTEITYGLQHLICQEAPKSLYNICDNFVGGLLPSAYDKFLYYFKNQQVCEKIRAC